MSRIGQRSNYDVCIVGSGAGGGMAAFRSRISTTSPGLPARRSRLRTASRSSTVSAISRPRAPSEDFARATIEYEADSGETLIGEVTTSWSFVGAGLRLSAELLGPEYSMSWNTLDTGLKLFFSREVKGDAGEDLVEKQNAEMGLMPVVADEAEVYGYTAENRHFARAFLNGDKPMLSFEDGVEVMEILMAAYMSAEQGRTVDFPPPGLDGFVPEVGKGTWRP